MVSRQAVTLANCIVGVSVLAMPFCFKQCGVVLASTLLMLSGVMTRTVCYFLLKASTITRRRTYELLAYHTFGQAGKLVVEISIIGFLIGTLIAFLVVMGDLGPEIMADVFNVENNASLRTIIMTALSLFVALPLGLLRNIDSLSSVSTVTMLFYMILVAKIFSEGMGPLWSGSFLTRIHYWRPAGVLQCIPIFSMALSCQTQIFSIYDSLPEPSLQKMNEVIRKAVNACTAFYISVGFLGYIAFCTQNFGGNILLSFGPTWSTQMIKICFVLSIAFSFPLVIFPCRASLHSLIFRRVHTHHLVHDITTNYIPESRLKLLTVGIIGFTLFVGLMIPNIELVLGLVGSTTGSVICIIFPSVMFIRVTSKNTTERILAQAIFFIGVIIMVVTTYATLYAAEQAQVNDPKIIEQPLTESLKKIALKDPVIKNKEPLSREIEKLVPKLPPDIPPPVKNADEEKLKEHEGNDRQNEAPQLHVDAIQHSDKRQPEVDPEKVVVELVHKSLEKENVPESAVKELDLKPKKEEVVPPPLEQVPDPPKSPVDRRPQEPQRPVDEPPAERKEQINPQANQEQAPEIPKKQRKLQLLKQANTTASPRSLSANQSVSLKQSPEKRDQEDFLLQQLKEHEKEQKKLLEEQKEILAKLKQHQAEDELKDQLREGDKEIRRRIMPVKDNGKVDRIKLEAEENEKLDGANEPNKPSHREPQVETVQRQSGAVPVMDSEVRQVSDHHVGALDTVVNKNALPEEPQKLAESIHIVSKVDEPPPVVAALDSGRKLHGAEAKSQGAVPPIREDDGAIIAKAVVPAVVQESQKVVASPKVSDEARKPSSVNDALRKNSPIPKETEKKDVKQQNRDRDI